MAQAKSSGAVDTRDHPMSWLLTFRFDGERIDLVRQERVRRIAPGTTADKPEAGRHSGAWIELVGRSGELLFHRLLHDPLRTRAEHHSPDGRIELHFRAPQLGEFVAVLPDLPGAIEAVLYSSPTDHERMFEAAQQLGRYRLGEPDRPDGGGKGEA